MTLESNPLDSTKKIEEAELTYKGEQAMTPKQAGVSGEREENYGKLSLEQTSLLKDCVLTIKDQSFAGVISGQKIIKGSINGSKVEIIFNPTHGPGAGAEATLDGKKLSREEGGKLVEKYKAIAEFQTKDSERAKRTDSENTKISQLRQKIKNLLS